MDQPEELPEEQPEGDYGDDVWGIYHGEKYYPEQHGQLYMKLDLDAKEKREEIVFLPLAAGSDYIEYIVKGQDINNVMDAVERNEAKLSILQFEKTYITSDAMDAMEIRVLELSAFSLNRVWFERQSDLRRLERLVVKWSVPLYLRDKDTPFTKNPLILEILLIDPGHPTSLAYMLEPDQWSEIERIHAFKHIQQAGFKHVKMKTLPRSVISRSVQLWHLDLHDNIIKNYGELADDVQPFLINNWFPDNLRNYMEEDDFALIDLRNNEIFWDEVKLISINVESQKLLTFYEAPFVEIRFIPRKIPTKDRPWERRGWSEFIHIDKIPFIGAYTIFREREDRKLEEQREREREREERERERTEPKKSPPKRRRRRGGRTGPRGGIDGRMHRSINRQYRPEHREASRNMDAVPPQQILPHHSRDNTCNSVFL